MLNDIDNDIRTQYRLIYKDPSAALRVEARCDKQSNQLQIFRNKLQKLKDKKVRPDRWLKEVNDPSNELKNFYFLRSDNFLGFFEFEPSKLTGHFAVEEPDFNAALSRLKKTHKP